MSESRNRWLIHFRDCVALLVIGCAQTPPSPRLAIDPSPWASDIKFETLPDRIPVGENYSWEFGQRGFVEFAFTPPNPLPQEHLGRTVNETKYWAVTLAVFESGSTRQDDDAVWLPIRRYHVDYVPVRPKDGIERFSPTVQRNCRDWELAGFDGDPDTPTYVVKSPQRYFGWTFLALPQGLSGEFEYEILIYPTVIFTKNPFQPDLGEPVVLRRGTFMVHPKTEPSDD